MKELTPIACNSKLYAVQWTDNNEYLKKLLTNQNIEFDENGFDGDNDTVTLTYDICYTLNKTDYIIFDDDLFLVNVISANDFKYNYKKVGTFSTEDLTENEIFDFYKQNKKILKEIKNISRYKDIIPLDLKNLIIEFNYIKDDLEKILENLNICPNCGTKLRKIDFSNDDSGPEFSYRCPNCLYEVE